MCHDPNDEIDPNPGPRTINVSLDAQLAHLLHLEWIRVRANVHRRMRFKKHVCVSTVFRDLIWENAIRRGDIPNPRARKKKVA